MAAPESVPADLIERCSKAGIKVAVRREGLVVEAFELPVRSNARTTPARVFTELLEHADAHSLPVAATPEKVGKGAGEQALERWYQGFGFHPNNHHHPEFLQTWVRDATQGPEQQLSELTTAVEIDSPRENQVTERDATLAAATELQRDPLDRHREQFGDRWITWVGRRAVELGPRVAAQSPEWLREQVGSVDNDMAQAPRFRSLAPTWMKNLGERGARAIAVEGELARRRSGQDRGDPGTGQDSTNRAPGADRWARVPHRYRELFEDKHLNWLEDRAGALRMALESKPPEFLREQREELGTVNQAFDLLDQHAAEIAARDVAVRRELAAREEMALASSAARSADAQLPTLAVPGEDIDQLTKRCRRCLGDERAAAIVKHGRELAKGMQEMDPAALGLWGARLGDPLEGLDVDHALAVRRAEAAVRVRIAQSRQESAMAAAEYAKASKRTGRGGRDAQREHVQAGDAHRATAEKLTANVDSLRLGQQQIRDQGLHPDQWIAAHGDRAARAIAARATLERHREQELGSGRETGQEIEVQPEVQPVAVEQRALVAVMDGPGL